MRATDVDPWRVWVDTGGTFTDCVGLSPNGELSRVKVLSSSALRGTAELLAEPARPDSFDVRLRSPWSLPEGFANGAELRQLGGSQTWQVIESSASTLRLSGSAEEFPRAPRPMELVFEEEAPVLAARLLTGAASVRTLPPLHMRLATTRGTNALLQRRGAETVFLVTRGFGDLLIIGEQHRPDLFARHIVRPEPIYGRVIEVEERLDAEGRVLRPLDLEALRPLLKDLRGEGFEAAAVALMHSYLRPEHEEKLAELLRDVGFEFVSTSAALTPTQKILPRARTAVVDAYLSPVVGRYLERVQQALGTGRDTGLWAMTSAGGLVSSADFRAKDSLLSGPAGGVVGAARCGRLNGRRRVVAFDMGGTSTDVSRFEGDFDYCFEHSVAGVSVAAPALRIETVAAGGGSICAPMDGRLRVGPRSAGADPGPACYGAGGPLTLTDANLLLGRLDGERFEIPIEADAARRRVEEQLSDLRSRGSSLDFDSLLAGYITIANQRMADAVRRISVRQGYDPRVYAMVAFGGAGGLHACEVAEDLGMDTVFWPRQAGLLSALGLGAAVVERIEERQVLEPLPDAAARVPTWCRQMAETAVERVPLEQRRDMRVRRRLVYLRLQGQESTLEVEWLGLDQTVSKFWQLYQERYGYRPKAGALELESLRVVVSAEPLLVDHKVAAESARPERPATPKGERSVLLQGRWRQVPVFDMEDLEVGDACTGPALVFDRHASMVIPPGWRGRASSTALVARLSAPPA